MSDSREKTEAEITRQEMAEKISEVAEMSDMLGNPAALTKDDMWAGAGDFSRAEEQLLREVLQERFGCNRADFDRAAIVEHDTETPLQDDEGYALYVLCLPDRPPIYAIGASGYTFDS